MNRNAPIIPAHGNDRLLPQTNGSFPHLATQSLHP
jgi:hypothetical protein